MPREQELERQPLRLNQASAFPRTIPLTPELSRNSTIPIESFVICEAMVPKLIAGERQAKYKKQIAGTTFFRFLKPSVQSDA